MDMKHILWPIAGVVVFVIAVGFLTQKVQQGKLSFIGQINSTPIPSQQKQIKVKNTQVSVDIASTEKDREKGLGGRTSLGDNQGMLFVFPNKGTVPSFWMKDMLISIDIIWLKDGKVSKIDKNVPAPAPGTADDKLTIYNPNGAIDYVLEVNAGFSTKNNVLVGDPVDLTGI